MAKEQRNTFTFYASFEEAINDIEQSDKETQLMLYRAICRYGLYKEDPKLTGIAKIVWRIIEPILQKQWKLYYNGKNGGAPTGNTNASKTTKKQPKNNQTSLLKDKDKDKDKAPTNVGCGEGVCFDEVIVFVKAKQVQNPADTARAYHIYLQGRTDIKSYQAYFDSWYTKIYLPEVRRIEREEEARSVQQEEAERKKQAECTGNKAFEYYCSETKSDPNDKRTQHDFAEYTHDWCKKHGNAELSVFYETFVKEYERKGRSN